MAIDRILVVGAGLMGTGIGQVCAQRGLQVVLCDSDPEALVRARKSIAWSVAKLVEKGAVPGPAEQVLERIRVVERVEDGCEEVELVIEAVNEVLALKREVFSRLDTLCGPTTLLASNTSALSVSELAACTGRPDRVLGLHFFSPVPMMEAVEVVRGITTSDETFATGIGFVEAIGKTPIRVERDVPGFIVNRINLPSSIEAIRVLEEGIATVEEIDRGIRLATGRKMGPFETGDLVGLDVTHGALLGLYQETRDPRWYPPLMLRRKVQAGHLGRKTGRGWYEYGPDAFRGQRIPRCQPGDPLGPRRAVVSDPTEG
jgi:3-hydroxybutyryl-CoA dehydrogenase